ncbi:hypothetical protein [Rhizobacter sp. Root1221]|uniref:hypothetical protein n=1 Tax=Rhizobacter sp. Root1221 TaxID=1736433 RepID=UPI0006F2D958|nr:hypothetical protein [Rhizobacter sp. Root1221]KQV88756.1 hypothetical protein ASC87_28765 [Rhizobacter sp. Root1221]
MNTLHVYKLAIQSSYTNNTEEAADPEHFDTVQWWVTTDGAWRIRTFAADNDVHLHHVQAPVEVDVLRETTQRNYEDVIADAFQIDLPDLQDADAITLAMGAFGGATALEIDRNGARFAFWNPLRLSFASQSEPE